MGGPRYTRAEVERIRREYASAASVAALAAAIGRTPEAVKQKAFEFQLHRPRTVAPDSPRSALQRAIVERYATAPDLQVLAAELGTTIGTLKGLAYRLGVKRDRALMRKARVKGGHASVEARARKKSGVHTRTSLPPRTLIAATVTPLDAAWRGLLQP
jgi:hypothetical protein